VLHHIAFPVVSGGAGPPGLFAVVVLLLATAVLAELAVGAGLVLATGILLEPGSA